MKRHLSLNGSRDRLSSASRRSLSRSLWQRSQPAAVVLAAAMCFGGAAQAQLFRVSDDWTRNFRLGMQVAFNIQADFALDGVIPTGGGDPGLPGIPGLNHFYDDGYVRVDNTGNSGGLTSYWGYQSATQFEP